MSKKDIDDLGLFASVLGHIGDGNFHTSILYDRSSPDERARVEKVVYDMVGRALEMEGTCTGEHGIGIGKKASLVEEVGEETIELMRTIKRAIDPHWLMNPGKIFDWDGGITAAEKGEGKTAAGLLEQR
jgi:D-lactate dehydrogenase (cytochrome)